MLTDKQDAYGHEIFDYSQGKPSLEIVERDDGLISFSQGPEFYFAPFKKWPNYEKSAIRYCRGRVLDIGCGAGRVPLYLQEQGIDCTAIDISTLAVKVCQQRGVKDARVIPITRVSRHLGEFDTIVMFGNNFGLMGGKKRSKKLLDKFYRMTSPQGRIIASAGDPYVTKEPEDLDYHKYNRSRGRMPGQLRLRVRYKKFVTPWFDYLMVSRPEMKELLGESGWVVKTIIDSGNYRGGYLYAAIIEKA